MRQMLYLPAVTFPTLAANASGDNTVSVPGVLPGDLIRAQLINPPAHLTVDNAYVSAADTVTIRWGTDATGVATATVPVLMEVIRPEASSIGITNLPSRLV